MPASLDFFAQLDLATTSADGSATQSPVTVDRGLAYDIAARATLAMRNASDAIAAWVAGEKLAADAAVLNGLFSQQRYGGEWRVANIAFDRAGELTIRFTDADAECEHTLNAVRLSADGALIGQSGERMIPAALTPLSTLPGTEFRFDGGFTPVALLGVNGPWGLFSTLGGEEEGTHVDLLSATLSIPPEAIFVETHLPISDDAQGQLLALHLKSLKGKVGAFMAQPLSGDLVFEIGNFLRQISRRFLSAIALPTLDSFHPDEVQILAPVFDLLQWPIATDEWRGAASIDTSSGWRADVRIEAIQVSTGVTVETEVSLLRNSLKAGTTELDWFCPQKRLSQAVTSLASAREALVAPKAAAQAVMTATPRRKAKAGKAVAVVTSDDLTTLRDFASLLKPHATTDEQLAALTVADGLTTASTELEANTAYANLSERFASLAETLPPAAVNLLSVRVWTAEQVSSASKLLQLADSFAQIRYSDEIRTLNDFVGEISKIIAVREVSAGWWVMTTERERRGAVSITGYYSTCANITDLSALAAQDPREVVAHLLSDAICKDRFKQLAKTEKHAARLIEWLKVQRFAPDENAVRRLIQVIAGQEQRQKIRCRVADVLTCLLSSETSRNDARIAYQAVECDKVEDGTELFAARIARDLFAERFGELREIKRDSAPLITEEEAGEEINGGEVGDEEDGG